MKLANKVALVTGAGGGIGRATATLLAEEGAHVAAADLRYEAALATAACCDSGFAIELNVTEVGETKAATDAVVERFGALDILVNSAGVLGFGAAEDLNEADWDRCLDVNLKGTYLMAKAAWPHLAQSSGVIINLGSILGVTPLAADIAYCASKAGVIMLTRCFALDGAVAGIRANAVSPGYILTPMTSAALDRERNPEEAREAAVRRHPLGRLGEPTDIAKAVAFLASEEASWVTGANLLVDGGYTAGPRTEA